MRIVLINWPTYLVFCFWRLWKQFPICPKDCHYLSLLFNLFHWFVPVFVLGLPIPLASVRNEYNTHIHLDKWRSKLSLTRHVLSCLGALRPFISPNFATLEDCCPKCNLRTSSRLWIHCRKETNWGAFGPDLCDYLPYSHLWAIYSHIRRVLKLFWQINPRQSFANESQLGLNSLSRPVGSDVRIWQAAGNISNCPRVPSVKYLS